MGFPGLAPFMTAEHYYQFVTMHGMIMVVYFLTALFLGGFGNYLIPLMVGARDMVFPYLNMVSFWSFFVAVAVLLPNDDKIKKLSANVMDIDEYVVDIANNEGLAEGLKEIDGGVTVHHACHARAQNMGIKARDMLKLIPNVKIDVVERCAGHGGTFGVMKETHDLANKVGRPTARQIKTKNNKYMASDCPLAGKHLKQLEVDTNISNDEALHPIELMAKSYNL